MLKSRLRVLTIFLLTAVVTDSTYAQPAPPPLPVTPNGKANAGNAPGKPQTHLLTPLKWRNIGPTAMGGRIVALAVVESDPSTFWVASASGGLFKTVNNGITFEPQFQHAGSISIGDVAVSQSNPGIVWVGTGEHNARNSVSWGDGVYKSIDGGKTWKHMGLKKSFQIGRIAIHPTNPEIVYVGALGRLWGENKERGLYKTEDGGKTWKKILYVDDKTGVIEVKMHPRDPETLMVATYQRKRDIYDGGDPAVRFGKGSAIYKTTDGGASWKKMTKGLPTVKLGRVGIEYSRSNPQNVFAIVETERIGEGKKGAPKPALMGINGGTSGTARLVSVSVNGPADKAGLQAGDIITAVDGKAVKSYADLIRQIRAHKAGDKVKIKYKRGRDEKTTNLTFAARGGRRPFSTRLGGQTANVQNRQGEDGFQTGGVFKSTDGGESWTRINSLNPRPFYYSQIFVDPSDERYIYVLGIRAYRSRNGGRTFTNDAGRSLHPDHHVMWINPRNGKHIILGCDGGLNITYDRTRRWEFLNNLPIGQFYDVGVDTRKPYRVYGGMQDNGSWGGPSRTRGTTGPTIAEWSAIGGGDGFVCRVDPNDPNIVFYESQYGRLFRVNLKTGERNAIRRGQQYNFSWKTPFLLSPHNSRIYFTAGNYVFKSLNRGSNLRRISPKITRTRRGTATALAQSPREADVLYVGTDDGWLWITQDGGRNWRRLNIPGRDGNRRVNAIECSRFANGRCYVTLDGHYFDSDAPDVWMTNDYGKTWTSLNDTLPTGCTRVLREDVANQNLLYLGTEFGLYTSFDRGKNWVKLNQNLPNVAIHEIAVHPTAGEIVAGTHGRSIWILDVSGLRQITKKTLAAKVAFLKPKTATMWLNVSGRRFYGSKRFIGRNSEYGASLHYLLTEKAEKATISVSDITGKKIAEFRGTENEGLNRVVWNLRSFRRPSKRLAAQLRRLSARDRARYLARFGVRVSPGRYKVVLNVDGKEFTQTVTVARDPRYSATDSLTFEEQEWLRKMLKTTGED